MTIAASVSTRLHRAMLARGPVCRSRPRPSRTEDPLTPQKTMAEPSLTQQVLDRCREALFTGIVRVHARQAEGEIWFLSGMLERVRFGVSKGDDAMNRLLAAKGARIEVVPCLPNPAGGFEKGHPMEGELGTRLPVDLLRFCEMHALTCTVDLRAGDSRGEAVYRLGELVSVRCDAGTDRAVAEMLEWKVGRFRFSLPSIDLPTSVTGAVDRAPPAPPAEGPMATESSAWRTAANEALKRKVVEVEAKLKAEERRQADEAEPKPDAVEAEPRPGAVEAEPKPGAVEAEPKPGVVEAEPKPGAVEPAHRTEEMRPAVRPPSLSIVVRLQRVTTEYVYLSVPVTNAMMDKEPTADGSYRVGSEALFAEAQRRAREPDVAWQLDGEPRVGLHPEQTSPTG
jgi:hypothetical protein